MANSLSQSLNILGTQAAVSESTDYDYTTPEEALILNRENYNARLAELVGTIGPTPYHQTEEFYQEALDIAEGLAFPGAGVGASIRGGKQALGNVAAFLKDSDTYSSMMGKLDKKGQHKKELLDWLKRNTKSVKDAIYKKPPPVSPRKLEKKKHWDKIMDFIDPTKNPKVYERYLKRTINEKNKVAIQRMVEQRKMEDARKALDAIMKKHGIADPDKAEFVDPITGLLTRSRN